MTTLIEALERIENSYQAFLTTMDLQDHPVILLGYLTAVKAEWMSNSIMDPIVHGRLMALLDHDIERITNIVLEQM